jgi:hypothetical protein
MQGRPAEKISNKEDFFMAEIYGSRGATNAGLTTGIIGTSLGALNSGFLGNLFGTNNHGCGENSCVNRYELGLEQKIGSLESAIALRDANIYNDGKMLELYKYIDGKVECINSKIADQAVFNATTTATMNCIAGQVNSLLSLTKLIVPNSSICPGYGNVTVTPAAATTTTAAII